MNILIVHPCKGFYGGAEEVVMQLCRYLTKDGHPTFLISKDVPNEVYSSLAEERQQLFNIRNCKSFFEMRSTVQRKLKWADVVSVHNAPAPLMTFPKKVPTVYMCNEPMELFTSWKRKPIEAFNRRWVGKSGMKVVVADEFNRRRFEKIYGVEPTVIPYGIDYEFWSKPVSFKRVRDWRVRILQVGTITPYKNQLKSICLLAELLSKEVDATLTLVGRFADKRYYNKLVNDYISIANEEIPGFESRVTFTGQVTPEQIRGLCHRHDVLFHPVEEQGGWLVPFEAMCAGLPVIVEPGFSASGLIRENGLGVASGDRGFMAAKAIIDKEYEKLDTERIKLWVKENLTWERFGEQMVRTFEEAIDERKGS